MNRCPNCAAQNREGAKFCTSCGFRLPVTAAPTSTSDRSPFATTSTVPPHADQVAEPPKAAEPSEEPGFATWNAPPPAVDAPGRSWDAPPPTNTAVPVDENMIASLVGDNAPPSATADVSPDPAPEAPDPATWATPHPAVERNQYGAPSVDQLLKLVRELEYGLVELVEAPMGVVASTTGSANYAAVADSRLLSNALADLQDEDELAPLRSAVASAQERPRDVDVMLDLVLRADAIAAVLTERDQLKAAIELAVGDSHSADSQPVDDTETATQDEVVAESTSDDVAVETLEPAESTDDESPSI
jgi:hypothetical protein